MYVQYLLKIFLIQMIKKGTTSNLDTFNTSRLLLTENYSLNIADSALFLNFKMFTPWN